MRRVSDRRGEMAQEQVTRKQHLMSLLKQFATVNDELMFSDFGDARKLDSYDAAVSSQRRNTDWSPEASRASKSSAGLWSWRTSRGRLLSSFSTA